MTLFLLSPLGALVLVGFFLRVILVDLWLRDVIIFAPFFLPLPPALST